MSVFKSVCVLLISFIIRLGVHANQNCTDPDHRIIIMADSRSGSTILTELISKLTNSPGISLEELFGQSYPDMLKVTTTIDVMKDFFARRRKVYPNGYIGFKWKPMVMNEHYDRALQWASDKCIPIVYSFRNFLDVAISEYKHHSWMVDHKDKPHCKVNDTKCIENHLSFQTTVDPHELLKRMQFQSDHRKLIMRRLKEVNAKNYVVSYESLFLRPNKLHVWQDLIKWVDPSFDRAIESGELEGKFAVTHGDRADAIKNFKEVETVLQNNNFGYLLLSPNVAEDQVSKNAFASIS